MSKDTLNGLSRYVVSQPMAEFLPIEPIARVPSNGTHIPEKLQYYLDVNATDYRLFIINSLTV